MDLNKKEYLLVSDTGKSCIMVFDTVTGSLSENIKMSANSGPHGITVCENGQFLCFSNQYSNSIQIYDVRNNNLDNEIPTGATPCHIAEAEGKLYISNGDSDSISVVDINDKTGTVVIPSGRMPHDIVIYDKFAVSAESGSDSIGVIDTGEDEYSERIELRCSPVHMCIIPGKNIIAAACTEYGMKIKGYISLIDINSFMLLDKIGVGNCLTDIIADEDGVHVYVTDGGRGGLYKINIFTGLPVKAMFLGGYLNSVTADTGMKRLFAADSINNIVYIINKESWVTEKKITAGRDISHAAVL